MTVRELLRDASAATPLDRELIIAHVLGRDRAYLYAHPERRLGRTAVRAYRRRAARRARGEPLPYVVGTAAFGGLDLIVNRHVFIPRPETAWLVEAARRSPLWSSGTANISVVDVGTGSGAIITALFASLPSVVRRRCRWYATDTSPRALAVAKHNARRYAAPAIQFLRGDLLQPLAGQHHAGGWPPSAQVLLLANLPYLTTADYRRAPDAVKKFEPPDALLAGRDGLQYYRRLVSQLAKIPGPTFHCYWEIDPCHSRKLKTLVQKTFPQSAPRIHKDFNNLDRYLTVTLVPPVKSWIVLF